MISIITPTNNSKYLQQVYSYLLDQTIKEWEWILVLNGDLRSVPVNPNSDSRIKLFTYTGDKPGVGALKKFACSKATGEYILELDHDDFLLPKALEKVEEAFKTGAVFVYSDDVGVRPDFTTLTYGKEFGWTTDTMIYKDYVLDYHPTPEPIPQHISKIWYAPDHLRAWRKDVYDRIGGHNEDLPVADDHELMCRLYLEGKFEYIPECLYIYNVHGDNTWLKNTDEIQSRMWDNHDRYIMPMMMKWSTDNGLLNIDLCGALNKPEGFISVDRHNADIVCDLNGKWDIPDNSVGVLRASNAIEHLKDPIHTMNEAYRVLAHGGLFFIDVPSTDGKGAWCDPTHVSFWNDRSFRYYTEAGMRIFLEPECKCKFMLSKLNNMLQYDENLPFVRVYLYAIKDGKRIMGQLNW